MARKQKQTSTETNTVSKIVVPLIRSGDDKHPLETIFEGNPKHIPVLKAVGFAPMGVGNSWVSYIITTRGNEVLSIQVSEPNLRQIAEESAKTDFVTEFMDKGL